MSFAAYGPAGCHAASGALIFYGLSGANRRFQFQKRSQLFIRTHNVTLSVAAMGVSNPDRSPVSINR